MLREQDLVKSQRVMQALFKMKKIDIAELKKAYAQE
jgi:predicted 3-demethylubiquinone-9 3-methyltransferase (glyoxalase superfamily)